MPNTCGRVQLAEKYEKSVARTRRHTREFLASSRRQIGMVRNEPVDLGVRITNTATQKSSQDSQADDEPVVFAGKEQELKKFTFSKENKYLLYKCVRQVDAHRAPHRKKEKAFEFVRELFVKDQPVRCGPILVCRGPKLYKISSVTRLLLARRKMRVMSEPRALVRNFLLFKCFLISLCSNRLTLKKKVCRRRRKRKLMRTC